MNINSASLYSEREKRIRDAIELKQPDRVPFAPFCSFFSVTQAGFGFEEAMHDYDKLIRRVINDGNP